MEIIHRDEKYRAYLKKIRAASAEVTSQMSRRSLEEKVDLIHHQLKQDTDSQEYTVATWMLAIPLLAIVFFCYTHFGGAWRLFPILLMVMYFLYARMGMNTAKKKANIHKSTLEKYDEIGNQYLNAKIQYIKEGTSIKLQRLQTIRMFYALFFPIFVVYFLHLAKTYHIFGNLWLSLLVAYLISGVFWWLYFVNEVDELKFIIKDLKSDSMNLEMNNKR